MRGATEIQPHINSEEQFQSTRPMRGATGIRLYYQSVRHNFNPRAPCGARRDANGIKYLHGVISIHAPHAGRDFLRGGLAAHVAVFQSTRPMRGATPCGVKLFIITAISIHAPHAGRDQPKTAQNCPKHRISIHAPHAGRDRFFAFSRAAFANFNPRAPCGARHQSFTPATRAAEISIHAPHAGRDTFHFAYSKHRY